MASSEHIKALLRSHIQNDGEQFLSVALQVAAHEARSGHGVFAQELRDIIERAKSSSAKSIPISIAKKITDSTGLLDISHPKMRLNDLISPEEVKSKLERLVLEQRHMSSLKNHGLSPQSHVLLVGPSGTGKTFTASVLAGELDYPLFQVRLDSLITKFMGESSAKLRQVFDAMNDVRGVYFFDEFDALGSQRSSSNDVGEARRILNSFLQMIEQDNSNSLIICATNHIEVLDHALFRRFDEVVQYGLPAETEIVTLFQNRLKPYVAKNFAWKKLPELAKGLSHADITKVAEDAIKSILIHKVNKITMPALTESITSRKNICKNLFNH